MHGRTKGGGAGRACPAAGGRSGSGEAGAGSSRPVCGSLRVDPPPSGST
ncbi:hypothetical protein PSMK_12490 [Phycisphaera mikurensis NBRC 102666]|uniref:Uncharacterized protein n=1 Tax=Phycisphaera mikurensis (strain NBRC 102666 / KCTC 22515 / FYK2301M01) TaxID=1142394 RepID=I0IDS0_PHYMF|nr:hypothetical protein PSMK_12490 [Phycisphaera mikurensis NBRC 102666]